MPVTLRLDKAWSAEDQDALIAYNNALGRQNFWAFRQIQHPTMIRGWFQRRVAKELLKFHADLVAGKRPIMILQSPPQHGKSRQIVDFICWAAGLDPSLKVIYGSFSDRLGVRANLWLQRMMDHWRYVHIFGSRINAENVVTRSGKPLRNREMLEWIDSTAGGEGIGGYFRNTTVMGSVTGEGADLGIIDDPIKGRAEANSPTVREKTWGWLTDDFMSRFSDHAGLLMIMTRWHVDDPAGRMIAAFPNVKEMKFKAIATEDEFDEASGDLLRRKGEPLFPEFKSLDFLLKQKAPMTLGGWESLYQQNPIIVGGGIFPIEKFGIPLPARPSQDKVKKSIRYWDKAGCFVANTMVSTEFGQVPIQKIKPGDMVWTRKGLRRVKRAWLTKYVNKLVTVRFSNGSELTATPDHNIWANWDWAPISTLGNEGYTSCLAMEGQQWKTSGYGSELSIRARKWFGLKDCLTSVTQRLLAKTVGAISTIMERRSIGQSGAQFMATSPLDVISITRMRTGTITRQIIWSASEAESTTRFTDQRKLSKLLWANGIEKITRGFKSLARELLQSLSLTFVKPAEVHSWQGVTRLNFASERSAVELGTEPNIGSVPVYDIEVEGEHEFFANGILVHNSQGTGAYTAGVRIDWLKEGGFVVSDVRRGQWAFAERETIIKQTAMLDNQEWRTEIWVEQEPGSGGKESADRTIANLAGFSVYKDRVRGDKELRAEPYAAQVQAGNVGMVEAKWNRDFIDEHESFPNGKYKDQVDAAGGAFAKLVARRIPEPVTVSLPFYGDAG